MWGGGTQTFLKVFTDPKRYHFYPGALPTRGMKRITILVFFEERVSTFNTCWCLGHRFIPEVITDQTNAVKGHHFYPLG